MRPACALLPVRAGISMPARIAMQNMMANTSISVVRPAVVNLADGGLNFMADPFLIEFQFLFGCAVLHINESAMIYLIVIKLIKN